jgi:hypothetical protein
MRSHHASLSALAVAVVVAVTLTFAAGSLAAPAVKHGSVTLEPGYVPAVDPESASVRLGRRANAPLVHKGFLGGARSLDGLGRDVCRALFYERLDSLFVLCVRKDEFRDILWPEFPQSRPATGITAGDGWMFLEARLHGGASNALTQYGGKHWTFVRFERYDTTAVFKNFKLHKGLVMWAKDEAGNLERMTWFRVAAERKGRFKIYSVKD